MNLLYDLAATQPSEESKFHGGGEYAHVVFQKLITQNINGINLLAFYNSKKWIDPELLHLAQDNGVVVVAMQNKYDIEKIIVTHCIERFYSALPYNYYDLDLGSVEFIYTIHGLRSIEMPTDRYEILYANTWRDRFKYIYKQLFRERYVNSKRKSFRRLLQLPQTSKIIVPSEHTKYALLVNFSFLSDNVVKVLFSPRTADVKAASGDILQEFGVQKKKYIFLISANRWLKNSYRALLAFDRLFTLYPDMKFKVLAIGLSDEKLINRLTRKLKNRERFLFYGYVDRDYLERFYKDAFCFVYPTLNEGFGYPPLDCMKYGTPVIASAITSIPEICNVGVDYYSPTSVEEIMGRVLKIVTSQDDYNSYSQKGMYVYNDVIKRQDQMLVQLVDELVK